MPDNLKVKVKSLSLCDPMDYSLPGVSVHGIFQARILEWVTISFSRGSSRLKDQTHVSCIVRQILYQGSPSQILGSNIQMNFLANLVYKKS